MNDRDYWANTTKIAGGTISADRIVMDTIKIHGSTTLSDWRNPPVNRQMIIDVKNTNWPTGNVHTQDYHEAKGPWKETLEVDDEAVQWRVEFPGVGKEAIRALEYYDRDSELIKIKVSAPYIKNGKFTDGDHFTTLDIPELGCYLGPLTFIDGVLYVSIVRGQTVSPLEIN